MTDDEAFARHKKALGSSEMAATHLFDRVLTERYVLGCYATRAHAAVPLAQSSVVLSPKYLMRHCRGFRISTDDMHVQLYPPPLPGCRLNFFFGRYEIDQDFPLADKPIARLIKVMESVLKAPRSPPREREEAESDLPKPDRTWVVAAYKRLKAEGTIRPGMEETALARALVREMERDPTVSSMNVRYVASAVESWDLWPVKEDQK